MAYFQDLGLEFVSVAPLLASVPERLRRLHVGGKEHGAALFIAHLTRALVEAHARRGGESETCTASDSGGGGDVRCDDDGGVSRAAFARRGSGSLHRCTWSE